MSDSSHTSSPLPRKSLPLEIHAATRSHHTSLNRLITSHLPLCLPPEAQTASTYTYGISAFAEIFFTFEREWTALISPSLSTDIHPRIQSLLRDLYIPALLRTTRLKHDLSLLSQDQQPSNHPHHSLPLSITHSLTSQISLRIHSRPHTLLAHPWILYLALFNGGRWIRSQLLSTPPSFWPNNNNHHPPEKYLTFWHFNDDQDREGLKIEFRRRFEEAAAQLTEQQRQDVIDEAVQIFQFCATIVEGLDRASAEQPQEETETETPSAAALSSTTPSSCRALISSFTTQLYGVLAWIWALVLGPVDFRAQRGREPRSGVARTAEVR